MFSRLFRNFVTGVLYRIFLFFTRYPKALYIIIGIFVGSLALTLLGGKIYQNWDNDPDRGALAMDGTNGNVGALGESFPTPVYLDQGWDAADSLWFYNTTQGSALMPYDFFLELDQASNDEKFMSPTNMDKFRYLPQKATFFNPDALPVGFVKDTYSGTKHWYQFFKPNKDYIGFTCAACHTGQLNYTDENDKTTAIRIDGGAAMADMVGFLEELSAALKAVRAPGEKQAKFVKAVLARDNDYDTEKQVIDDIAKWHNIIRAYNFINRGFEPRQADAGDYAREGEDPDIVTYGHARLDAFGRIYNRVLQYVISVKQAKDLVAAAVDEEGNPILNAGQFDDLFKGIEDSVILTDDDFVKILENLDGMGLSLSDTLILRNQIFNDANAPVSYPYLWDIVQSTYVQWNGLADNSGIGPLGRNVGEVLGVFGILEWEATESVWYRPSTWDLRSAIASYATGQSSKKKHVTFDSSVDVTNLQRLERKLTSLQSPDWPSEIFGKPDAEKVRRGALHYQRYCVSCHTITNPRDADRLLVSHMSDIDLIGTDPQTAENSVNYKGASGNFENVYQNVDGVGPVVIEQEAPVIQMLTAAATGVIATPDRDKWMVRRWLDWLYNLAASAIDNPIKKSVRAGVYRPNTTTGPYDSLLAYKARPLNGIWATAPYLHNGSVPTLYDLLLPSDCVDSEDGECRPTIFKVGARAFDKDLVGIVYRGLDLKIPYTEFDTRDFANSNKGHEYAAGKTAQPNGDLPPALNKEQRLELLEFLKTL